MVATLSAQIPPMSKVLRTDAGTGDRYLDHCQWVTIEQSNNVENVELYAVHPFPLYGLNFTDELPFEANVTGSAGAAMDVARATFSRRLFHNPASGDGSAGGASVGEWQEGPQAARLGMADEAAANVQLRAAWGGAHAGPFYSRADDGSSEHVMRFPGFYGPLVGPHALRKGTPF